MRQLLFADRLYPVSAPPIERGFILLDGDVIVRVGRQSDLPADGWGLMPRSYPVITPGLVNVHTHLSYTRLPVTDGSQTLLDWIAQLTDTVLTWSERDFQGSAELGVEEAVRHGTTCVADTFFVGASLELAKQKGLRGVFYQEAFGGLDRLPWLEEQLAALSPGPLQRVGVSPHAPYNLSAALWRRLVELGLPLHGHLAESPAELEWALAGTGDVVRFHAKRGRSAPPSPGLRPAAYLASIGGLAEGMILAHGVQLNQQELAILAEYGVCLAHCPRSNRLLNCGEADTASWDDYGIQWGIGTDSRASSGSLDLWDEAREAALLRFMSDHDLLKRLTLENARCLGLSHQIGSLDPGKQADVLACERLGGRVLLTICAGRAIYWAN